MKYNHYKVLDFVKDEYFQKWVLDSDTMTNKFWKNWQEKHPEKESVIEGAKDFILLLDYDNEKLSEADFDGMWQQIIEKRSSAQNPTPITPKVKRLYWKYAAAASVLLILALSLFLNNKNDLPKNQEPIIVNNQIKVGTEKATLTLEDGSEVTLKKGTVYKTKNVTSNGEEIVYDAKGGAKADMAYNTLTIPRGGQFYIKLSDGTKVWLNSESQLKYPVAFKDGQSRHVELIYGEAYFEVSPSTEHNGAHFKVLNNNQEIEVLGTQFNIKAYKDEQKIYTTLVEGRVEVITIAGKKFLKPNQQSIVNLSNHNIRVSKVNVYNEVAWKDGLFSFNDKSLKDIMKVMSRWYDMEVQFNNKEVENQEFIGVLGRAQSIEGVLSVIKSFGIINNYEINNKKVIIE